MPPKNPWTNICWYKTIADCDKPIIARYLVGIGKGKQSTQIHNEMLPEPFIGDLDASVYLLNGNPGVTPVDLSLTNNTLFEKQIQDNLCQRTKPIRFMWIAPKISPIISGCRHSGYDWWEDKLSDVLALKPDPKICNIEYFPYHSYQMPSMKSSLPSNDFVDWYIIDAVKKDKWIIVLRCKDKWLNRIPALNGYPKLLFCINPRNVRISPQNLCNSSGARISDITWKNLINAM